MEEKILREAKSQLQKDLVKKFYQENKKLIQFGLIALAVFLVITLVYNFHKNQGQKAASRILHESILSEQIQNVEDAKNKLKQIYDTKKSIKGIWSIASLRYAAVLSRQGDIDEALNVYENIGKCNNCDAFIRELAGLLRIKVIVADNERNKDKELLQEIKKYEAKAKILKYHFIYQRALLEKQNGNLDSSYNSFDLVKKSAEASEYLRTKSEDSQKLLILEGYKIGK